MNQSLMLDALENSDEAVVDWQNETRRELLQLESRVHQRRTVREKVEIRHHPIESPCGFLDLGLRGAIVPFRLRQVPRDAGEQFLRALDDIPFVVFLQVTLSKDAQGVLGQLRIRLTGHDVEGP